MPIFLNTTTRNAIVFSAFLTKFRMKIIKNNENTAKSLGQLKCSEMSSLIN